VSSSSAASVARTEKKPEDPEYVWSKRFTNAKTKLQEAKNKGEALQNKLKDLNLKLITQSDVYDREHLFGPMIAQTRQDIEKNQADIKAAEETLENLREDLRKSGKPISWQDSQKSLQAQPDAQPAEAAVKRDEKYWKDKLSEIEKKYAGLIKPLEIERFQLIYRRSPGENESLAPVQNLGMGTPPRVNEIDSQIKELNQKHEQEKNNFIEEAIRQGALPGWFR
jgi:predicted  nucleic acid-binding Zn-ribbon protein